MRGEGWTSGGLFSYVDVEARIPAKHPLRAMRRLTNAALSELDGAFSAFTRGSDVRPFRRSGCCGRRFCSFSIRYGRSGNWPNGSSSTCCFAGSSGCRSTRRISTLRPSPKNRDRLLTQEIAQRFPASLLALPEVKGLLSAEHFSVDGTQLKAWASMKSFRPKDGSGEPPSPGRNSEGGLPRDAALQRDTRLGDGPHWTKLSRALD